MCTLVINWNASIAFALLLVTARMYTSLARMYRKEQDPSIRTGVRLATLSPSRALSMCVRKAAARLRLASLFSVSLLVFQLAEPITFHKGVMRLSFTWRQATS